jgi:hypothetical protein
VVIAALVVGAIAVAGNSSKAFPTTVVLSQAAARTTSSGTAHVGVSATATLDGNTTTVLTGDGATDFGAHRSTLTLRVGTKSEQLRSLNNVVYLSLTGATLPRGAHWLSISPADVNVHPQAAAAFSSNDPSTGLQFLSAVDGNPRLAGHETLDGADVAHYVFTLNLEQSFEQTTKAAEALKSSSVGRALDALRSLADLSKVPGEAWLDNEGRVRKFDITIAVETDGQHAKVVDEFRFSHFDEPVSVQAPPASDTVSFSEAPNFFSNLGG